MSDDRYEVVFRKPTEQERREANPNADMAAYFAYHTERHKQKLRDDRMSGGIYSDARKRDYPDWNK